MAARVHPEEGVKLPVKMGKAPGDGSDGSNAGQDSPNQLWAPQLPRMISDNTQFPLPFYSIFVLVERAMLCFGWCGGSIVQRGGQLLTAFLGLSFPLNRAVAPNATELQWCSDLLLCAGFFALSMMANDAGEAVTKELSLSLTTRGRLSDGTATVSENSKKLLVTWAVPLFASVSLRSPRAHY